MGVTKMSQAFMLLGQAGIGLALRRGGRPDKAERTASPVA